MADKNDKFVVYAYLMSHADRSKFSPELIAAHVEHCKKLDADGRLVICGPFLNCKGGMVALRAASPEEAKTIAESDPFISSGFETYELRTWQLACAENNYLL
jgi:uncharacterized protein YciI